MSVHANSRKYKPTKINETTVIVSLWIQMNCRMKKTRHKCTLGSVAVGSATPLQLTILIYSHTYAQMPVPRYV